jgi:hypothetical protein
LPDTSLPLNRIHPVKTIKLLIQFRVFFLELNRLLIKLKMENGKWRIIKIPGTPYFTKCKIQNAECKIKNL